ENVKEVVETVVEEPKKPNAPQQNKKRDFQHKHKQNENKPTQNPQAQLEKTESQEEQKTENNNPNQKNQKNHNQNRNQNQKKQNNFRDPEFEFDGIIESEGVLEMMPDGYGFLRSSDYNYL